MSRGLGKVEKLILDTVRKKLEQRERIQTGEFFPGDYCIYVPWLRKDIAQQLGLYYCGEDKIDTKAAVTICRAIKSLVRKNFITVKNKNMSINHREEPKVELDPVAAENQRYMDEFNKEMEEMFGE